MSEEKELTLETLQESLVKEVEARQALETRVENLVQSSSDSSEGEQPKEIEQLRGRIAELEQAEPSLKQQGAEEFVKSFEANKVENNELAQRIFNAIRGAGYDIVSKGQLAEATGEAEIEEGKDGETPEPPYLHIIDEPREGYFPWTEGKYAKIVEVVE